LKSSLEDFVADFELEWISDPQHPGGPLKKVPHFIDTLLILKVWDVTRRREIFGEGHSYFPSCFYLLVVHYFVGLSFFICFCRFNVLQ